MWIKTRSDKFRGISRILCVHIFQIRTHMESDNDCGGDKYSSWIKWSSACQIACLER